MFRQFAAALPGAAAPLTLFDAHPAELAWALESAWDLRLVPPPPPAARAPTGEPANRSDLPPTHPSPLGPLNLPRLGSVWPVVGSPFVQMIQTLHLAGPAGAPNARVGILWDHLIYAYMIENTRVFEIFRRVVERFSNGEQLGVPTPGSQAWLRNTEELFFKDGAPFYIGSVNSQVRPDFRANRRNWYHRMFGMDLNHGADDGKPYPYLKADAANADFVSTFEEFLREVWVGMTFANAALVAGPNPTDPGKIAVLATKIKDMLLSRRQSGNLSREEFAAVTAMSWFHLTLDFPGPAPIVQSLRAEASGAEQRLFKIAERVGLSAHGLSRHYFQIADPLAQILIGIELALFDTPAAVPALFTPGSPVEAAMRQIITHWAAITGRDVKARKVAAN